RLFAGLVADQARGRYRADAAYKGQAQQIGLADAAIAADGGDLVDAEGQKRPCIRNQTDQKEDRQRHKCQGVTNCENAQGGMCMDRIMTGTVMALTATMLLAGCARVDSKVHERVLSSDGSMEAVVM